MRPWDNFFWWLEADGLPPKSMVVPEQLAAAAHGSRPAPIEGKRLETNKVTVKLQADKVTVWLSPDLVDFTSAARGRSEQPPRSPRATAMVRPDLSVLLEDVRTRADRQHPFWAKLSTQ